MKNVKQPVLLEPQEAIDIIGQFFPKEWKHLSPEEVQIERIQSGFVNQVYIVSNSSSNNNDDDKIANERQNEHKKVVIRKYGGNSISFEKTKRTSLKNYSVTQSSREITCVRNSTESLKQEGLKSTLTAML